VPGALEHPHLHKFGSGMLVRKPFAHNLNLKLRGHVQALNGFVRCEKIFQGTSAGSILIQAGQVPLDSAFFILKLVA
jgi:hypothetical protein